MKKHQRVVVIGGGVAGLATAALMKHEGYEVVLVERTDELGGRAGEISIDGFRFETGPSWYLMPEAFDNFFAVFGTTPEEEFGLTALSPAYRLISEDGRVLDISTGRAEEIFESVEEGAGRALHKHLAEASEIYRIAVDRFLYTTFSDPRVFLNGFILKRSWWLLRLLIRSLDTVVAARFRHPMLRQVLTYPAVFLATRPECLPSLYMLLSHTDLSQGVFYPGGGFRGVVEALVRRCDGVDIKTSCEVTEITTDGGAATGVMTNHGHISGDVVVSCADVHHTETQLLEPALRSYPESWWDKRDPGPGAVVVMLGVRGELPELEHHTFFFSDDWTPDFDAVFGFAVAGSSRSSESIYVCRPSATDTSVAPEGCENLFILIPTAADPALGKGDAWAAEATGVVEEIADHAVKLIAQRAGIDDLDQRIVVRRVLGPGDFAQRFHSWSGGALGPAHTLSQSAFLRGKNISSKVNGLIYAGGTNLPGVGVPMCLISAQNAVTRLAESQ